MAQEQRKSFPYKLEPLAKEEDDRLKALYEEGGVRYECQIKEIDARMPPDFADIAERIYNMEVRDDDIWCVAYPKCGQTWTLEILHSMMNENYEDIDKIPHIVRSPFLEFQVLNGFPRPKDVDPNELGFEEKMKYLSFFDSVTLAETAPSPRIIKTHLPFDLLPPDLLDKAKVVYVIRNPGDCCASYFHHVQVMNSMYKFKGDFSDFAKMFMSGEVGFGSYFSHVEVCWWTNLLQILYWVDPNFQSAWKRRDHKNLKIIWYEDLRTNFDSVLKDLQTFFNIKLTEERVEEVKKRVTIDEMSKRFGIANDDTDEEIKEMDRKFFERRGQLGTWGKSFDDDNLREIFKNWANDRMQKSPVDFPTKLWWLRKFEECVKACLLF